MSTTNDPIDGYEKRSPFSLALDNTCIIFYRILTSHDTNTNTNTDIT
jgi:hypothetical protein